MFPGRFPNVPDTMWNFGWNPQPMGLPGQFCGGDLMNQQSQAQSQAENAGATCGSQGAKFHPESTTCVTSPIPYPASPTASSIPTIHTHSTSTSVHTISARTTNTGGTSIHTTWIQCILQCRGDDAADEEHGRIQYASFCGQEPRAKQESSSTTYTATSSNLSTHSHP